MLTAVANKLFRPNAIFIPTKGGNEGRDFDREDCTLLFVDGEYSYGEVYTEEAWKNGSQPAYLQRRGDFFLPDDSEIRKGRVQLLPDACIVKVPERDYWCEEVRAMTKRIFGVYAFDRRQHFHLCELCASYELWFVETQYEETDEVAEDEDRRDELNQIVLGAYEEPVTYAHRKEIDPMFMRGNRIRPGFFPQSDKSGGYRLRGLRAVTWDGVMEEIAEVRSSYIDI
ncbi:MAG: hypothetical protein ACLQNE_31960 [Thermoguttaceae bacterium]